MCLFWTISWQILSEMWENNLQNTVQQRLFVVEGWWTWIHICIFRNLFQKTKFQKKIYFKMQGQRYSVLRISGNSKTSPLFWTLQVCKYELHIKYSSNLMNLVLYSVYKKMKKTLFYWYKKLLEFMFWFLVQRESDLYISPSLEELLNHLNRKAQNLFIK